MFGVNQIGGIIGGEPEKEDVEKERKGNEIVGDEEKGDSFEMKSRDSHHLSNNIGLNDNSDIMPAKSDNTNVLNKTNKTDILKGQKLNDDPGLIGNITDDDISKNQKSAAYTSVWTYADRTMVSNRSQL